MTDLQTSAIDWEQFSLERPDKIQLKPKKTPIPHQNTALEKVEAGFKTADRGMLIMAYGTGKTYTSLICAEKITPEHGIVLFLVPSIALLSQTLREWTTEADNEDISIHDLAYPVTVSL